MKRTLGCCIFATAVVFTGCADSTPSAGAPWLEFFANDPAYQQNATPEVIIRGTLTRWEGFPNDSNVSYIMHNPGQYTVNGYHLGNFQKDDRLDQLLGCFVEVRGKNAGYMIEGAFFPMFLPGAIRPTREGGWLQP
jgi:hypothetical protein